MDPLTSPLPKVVIYGLVRDADGRPKIDDPATLHPAQIAMLTPAERAEFGVVLPSDWKGQDQWA